MILLYILFNIGLLLLFLYINQVLIVLGFLALGVFDSKREFFEALNPMFVIKFIKSSLKNLSDD